MPLARGFALKGTATSDGDVDLRKTVCAAVLHSMLCTLERNTGRLIILIAPRRPSRLESCAAAASKVVVVGVRVRENFSAQAWAVVRLPAS